MQRDGFDWNHARAFLATARAGSLSAAARQTGQTQPTVGRQVAAMEAALGVTLFERTGRAMVLTTAGAELAEHVGVMADAADRVALAASGQSQAIEGHVCITASDQMSAWTLPAIVARIRREAPGIDIELMASNSVQDLTRREADIAVRHVRPDQPDLITRLVRESTAHLYATTTYLERVGRPETVEDLAALDFVGYESAERMLPHLHALGLPLTRANFKVVSNSGVAVWSLVQQDLGVGIHLREQAAAAPGVEAILPDLISIPVPIWLTTHRELRTSRRIRLVFDALADALRALPDPEPPSARRPATGQGEPE